MELSQIKEKIDKSIKLDIRIKKDTKELDKLKASIQATALMELDNKNVKYIEYFGTAGSSQVGYKEKLEIVNYHSLCKIVGDGTKDNIKREVSIKITPTTGFKAALIAVYRGDAELCDLDKIITDLGLEAADKKAAIKKLKGDYWKDKALLESYGVGGDIEEELDAIRRHKNYEAAIKYVDIDSMDESQLKDFRRALSLEESLSIGFSYETD